MRRLVLWAASAMSVVLSGCQGEAAFRSSLSSPNPNRRAAAIAAMGRSSDPDRLAYLEARVGNPDPGVRVAVAEALGHLEDHHGADALEVLTGDSNEAVQLQAVASLGQMKGARARSYLLEAYRRGNSSLRAKVAATLRANGVAAGEAVQAEARALYEEYTKEIAGSGASRLTAAEQLGHSGRPEAVARLTDYLAADSRSLAISAARGLGASGAPEARPPLEALLTDEDPDLQVAGAEALGALGDPESAPALSRTIQHGGRAAGAALQSLLALPLASAEANKLLCGAALGPNVEVARRAGRAVHTRGLRCDAAPFVAKLHRGSGASAPEAVAALAGLSEIWAPPSQASNSQPSSVGQPPEDSDDADDDADDDDDGTSELASLARPIGDLLRNGPSDVRPMAARAITTLGLSDLASDLSKARAEAQAQIERVGEHWVKAPLLTPVGADDPEALPSLFSPPSRAVVDLWCEASVGEIRFNRQPRSPLMKELSADPRPRVRLAAVEAVRWLPFEEQWPALSVLAHDSDPNVRSAVVELAGRLTPVVAPAGKWLLEQLQEVDAQPDAPRGDIVLALGHYPGLPGAAPALEAELQDPAVAPEAISALIALGTPEARTALLSALRDPRGVALDSLVEAVSKLGDPAAAEFCRPLLFHVQPEVRAAAARALLTLEGPRAKSEVEDLAQDYDRRVRQAVALAK